MCRRSSRKPTGLHSFRVFFALACVVAASASSAAAPAKPASPSEPAPRCASARTPSELYGCLIESHPVMSLKASTERIREGLLDQASQFENPSLDLRTVTGTAGGETTGATELNLSLPVSSYVIGRGAKQDLARAEGRAQELELERELHDTRREALRDLHRLRQVGEELALVTEALETFGSIERQLRRRAARGPEQEITLNLVSLVQGDYELKKNHLVTEGDEIRSRLKVALGNAGEIRSHWLPPLRQKWPEIAAIATLDRHFEVLKSQTELASAEAEQGVARAASWPKVAAGPTVERATTGPATTYAYGINVSLELPIFSINSGGRKLAEARKIRAESLHATSLLKARLENEILLKKYRSAVESLRKSAVRESLGKNHERIDALFRQGLTGGSSVIEAHRQIYEFVVSQNEHEMTAVETLISIYQLEGKDPGEILK